MPHLLNRPVMYAIGSAKLSCGHAAPVFAYLKHLAFSQLWPAVRSVCGWHYLIPFLRRASSALARSGAAARLRRASLLDVELSQPETRL